MEIEEGQSFCPSCGECVTAQKKEEVTAPKKPPMTKKQKVKLGLAIVAGMLVLALLAGVLVLALRKNDVFYKDS